MLIRVNFHANMYVIQQEMAVFFQFLISPLIYRAETKHVFFLLIIMFLNIQ